MSTLALATLTPIAMQAIGALIASGLLGALAGYVLKAALTAKPEYKPVAQNAANYLAWAEINGIHAAEIFGVQMSADGPAKLKKAVDTTLQLLALAGVPADPTAVSTAKLVADLESLVPKIYPSPAVVPTFPVAPVTPAK